MLADGPFLTGNQADFDASGMPSRNLFLLIFCAAMLHN